jgi:MFS family permease
MTAQVTSLRSVGTSVYLPSMLFGIGQGAVVPVLVGSARDLGASLTVAGFVVALMGVGKIVADVPAGVLADRVGERRAMLIAVVVALVSLALCVVAPTVWILGAGVTGLGLAQAVWGLARQAYLTEVMPYHLRARALSTLGGTQRIGLFVGPFLSAGAVSLWGTVAAYAIHVVVVVVAGGVMLALPNPPTGPRQERGSRSGTLDMVRRHLPVLRTLAVGALLLSAVRAGRPVAIPLWAEHLGLDAAQTSLIFGISGGIEALVFYPAGFLMDRYGRLLTVLTSTLGLAVAYLLLPFTTGFVTLMCAGAVMGLFNGMGSGINMTISADVSPPENRPTFLGVWRLLSDIGNGLGPLLVGGVAAIALAPAVASLGVVSGLAALMMGVWLPRYSRRPDPITR